MSDHHSQALTEHEVAKHLGRSVDRGSYPTRPTGAGPGVLLGVAMILEQGLLSIASVGQRQGVPAVAAGLVTGSRRTSPLTFAF